MPDLILGRVRPVFQGEWSSTADYAQLDVVTSAGASYIARIDTPQGTLLSNGVYWEVLAEKGDQGIQGVRGPEGIQGFAGPEGPQGDVGPIGPQGDQGVQGVQGPQGVKGDTGLTGPQGQQGIQGPKGDKGDTGDSGAQGVQGPQGIQGETGISAYEEAVADGFIGDEAAWLASIVGPQGPQGIPGNDGATGPQGLTGPQGPQGVQGDQGIQGEDGPEGPQGPQGDPGPQGLQGIQGDQGPQGIQGDAGPAGADGAGLAAGGTPGQSLIKQSGTDFDTRWQHEWIKLVTGWSTAPTVVGTVAGANVMEYTYTGGTLYRRVPTSSGDDEFYSAWDGVNLSGLVASKRISI